MPSVSQTLGRSLSALPGGGRLLQRAVRGRRPGRAGVVFMLHRVLEEAREIYDPEIAVSLPALEAFLDWAREQFTVVPLEQLQAQLGREAADQAARPLAALTFDDGWWDTYTLAFPALQRRSLPATVFLPVHFIGSSQRFWQERVWLQLRQLRLRPDGLARLQEVGAEFAWCLALRADDLNYANLHAKLLRRSSSEAEAFAQRLEAVAGAEPPARRAFMNWDEVAAMQTAGFSFGSHTLRHTLLSCAPPEEAAAELSLSHRQLRERLASPVEMLSYPWGGLSPITLQQAAAAGYKCAVTTTAGWVGANTDPLRLPRLAISDAQLGWRRERGFHPGGLQVHLARARRREAPRADVPARQRLRVGIMVDNPDAWGPLCRFHAGSELQLLHLLRALPPQYFEPELYFLRLPASGLPQDWPWPTFAAAPTRGRPDVVVRDMVRLLRQRRPALVQTVFTDSLYLGVLAAWCARVPGIVCSRRNAGYWIKWYHRLGLAVINRLATSWQTNAVPVADMLQQKEHIPASGIEILPNQLDLVRYAPATAAARQSARVRLHLPEAGFIAVCVSNYRPVKDLPTLIAAAARARTRLPALRLLLVGRGDEEELRAEIARWQAEGQVELIGEQEHVEWYLAAADLGLLASRSEGCSNSVLEYMAAGLPTLLSDIPANRCLAPESLFPVGDAQACAQELVRLAEDADLRARRGARNRARAEAYGGEAFAARAQAHYVRAAAGVLARR